MTSTLPHAFIDTAVLIDLLQNYKPAIKWQESRGAMVFGITPTIWMDVMSNAPNMPAQQVAGDFLKQFVMVYPTEEDINWAMRQLIAHCVDHGSSTRDCMIASVCHRLQLPLFTRNLRPFAPVIPSLLRQPY